MEISNTHIKFSGIEIEISDFIDKLDKLIIFRCIRHMKYIIHKRDDKIILIDDQDIPSIHNIIDFVKKLSKYIHPITYMTHRLTKLYYNKGMIIGKNRQMIYFIDNNYIFGRFNMSIGNTEVYKLLSITDFLAGDYTYKGKKNISIVTDFTNLIFAVNNYSTDDFEIDIKYLHETIIYYFNCKSYDNIKIAQADIYLYQTLGRDVTNIILPYISSIRYHDISFGKRKNVSEKCVIL